MGGRSEAARARSFGRTVLAPVARILLSQGITAHQFARWVDEAFVRAAADLLREQGKEPSFSRIATLTGIHRHAVSTVMTKPEGSSDARRREKEYERNRLARVLSGWFESPAYTDASGRPLVLTMDGPEPSFVELVKAYSGDIYPGIILDELTRVGAVQRLDDGRLKVRSRRYTSGGADPEALRHCGIVAGDVLTTLEQNLHADPETARFEDAAISLELPSEAVPILAQLLERRAAAFLDDLEGWLHSAERTLVDQHQEGTRRVRAGVRVIMVADPVDPSEPGQSKK